MTACDYRETILTKEEKAIFDEEDKKEKELLDNLKKDLSSMTREEWDKFKIEEYID